MAERTVLICDRYGTQQDVRKTFIHITLDSDDKDADPLLVTEADLSKRARELIRKRLGELLKPPNPGEEPDDGSPENA